MSGAWPTYRADALRPIVTVKAREVVPVNEEFEGVIRAVRLWTP